MIDEAVIPGGDLSHRRAGGRPSRIPNPPPGPVFGSRPLYGPPSEMSVPELGWLRKCALPRSLVTLLRGAGHVESRANVVEGVAAANGRATWSRDDPSGGPAGWLVARRPRRTASQLPVLGLRGRQRHRPGGCPPAALPVRQHRPGRARTVPPAPHPPARATAGTSQPVDDPVGTVVPHHPLSRVDR